MKHASYLFLFVALFSCISTPKTPDLPLHLVIDSTFQTAMEMHGIPGAAVAVIHHGEVVHEGYYGKASLSFNVPVDSSHLFRIYSTTKLFIATAIFQLAEQRLLSIDDTISVYLPNLPSDWYAVRIKHLLTHSSGLPDFVQFDRHLSNDAVWDLLIEELRSFEPGSRWRYNQTNYWLLAQLIEQVSGQSLEGYIVQNQFNGDQKGVCFSSNSMEVLPNRITKYSFDFDSQLYSHSYDVEQSRGHAGNGLNITLSKFMEWNQRLDQGEMLSDTAKQMMWQPFDFMNDSRSFLFGWDDYSFENVKSYGFTGGGVSAFRKYPDHDLTIILLTSGYRYTPVHHNLVNRIAASIDPALENQAVSIRNMLMDAFLTQGLDEAMVNFNNLKKDHPDFHFESTLNGVGYLLLQTQRVDEAIEVFKLNAASYPTSSNCFDSLGEAYLFKGALTLALSHYERALELNPHSEHARNMIEQIRNRIE